MAAECIEIDPESFLSQAKIDIVKITEGGTCPENCIHCGASPNKGNSKDITPDQIEKNLTQEIEGTRQKVADALAHFVTTDVDTEPLYTESFVPFAKLVHAVTEGRSQVVCITHGLRATRNAETGTWKTVNKNTEVLKEINELMLQDIIPLTVISMDAARDNAQLGCKGVLEDKELILSNLRKQLEQERKKLTEIESEWKEKTTELEELYAEIQTIQFEPGGEDLAETLESERSQEEKFMERKSLGFLDTYEDLVEEQEIRDRRAMDGTIKADLTSSFLEEANSYIEIIRQLLGEFIEINKEKKICEEEIKTILGKIAEAENAHGTKERAVIESNARSYAATIKILVPAILANKRVTISVQGDDNRESPASMEKSNTILARALEILEEELGTNQFQQIRRLVYVEPRRYVAVGNAKSRLGMKNENTVDVIPDQEFFEKTVLPSYPTNTVHRGRIGKDGEIDMQAFRPNRMYNDTVDPKQNPWRRVRFL